jgi:hypothetical protein
MVMLYGWQILLSAGKIEMKDIYMMLLKITVVVSFTYNPWWYDQIYRFSYSFVETFSNFTTKIILDTTIDLEGNMVKDDGCYFGNLEDLMGTNNESKIGKMAENNYYLYPSDRRYIMFFDALDCKVQKYLGISYLGNASKMAQIVAISLIYPFNLGIYILVATTIFMFFTIAFVIKSAYYFITSFIALGFMLYISPLIIPCILFKKTKGFFDKWITMTLSFILQPMMMFAYISMAMSIIDQYTLGDAVFIGRGRNKQLMCGYGCIAKQKSDTITASGFETTGILINYLQSRNDVNKINEMATQCRNYEGETEFVDMKRNSVLCFIDSLNHGFVPFLQSLGIFIPQLVDTTLGDLVSFIRVAFLLLILNAVLGTIPTVIKVLIGGKGLPGASGSLASSPFQMAAKTFEYANGFKRGLQQYISHFKRKPPDRERGSGLEDRSNPNEKNEQNEEGVQSAKNTPPKNDTPPKKE